MDICYVCHCANHMSRLIMNYDSSEWGGKSAQRAEIPTSRATINSRLLFEIGHYLQLTVPGKMSLIAATRIEFAHPDAILRSMIRCSEGVVGVPTR